MAASAWTVFDKFREYVMDNTIDINDNTKFDLHLWTDTASASDDINNDALTALSQLTGEVASGNGYTRSGQIMSVTWASIAAGTMQWDLSADLITTGTGGNITSIRYALVVYRAAASAKDGTNRLCMRAALSTANFTLNSGSTLTVSTPTSGIFRLTGM